MGYLHKTRVKELYNLGLKNNEIRHKISQEFGIRLTLAQIQKIYDTDSFQKPTQDIDRSRHLLKIIEKIIKSSSSPLKAKAISAKIRSIHGERVANRDINKIIYNQLRDKVEYNPYLFTYKWKNKEKVIDTTSNLEEIVSRKIESLIGDIDKFDFNEELRLLFKKNLINVSTGFDKIDYLIKLVVKDNIITECEETFLKSKAKEFGYSEKIILEAKRSLEQNNPYLDNLIHVIFDDGLITPEELIFLKDKAAENQFTESFINERFWTIGLAEYTHHLTKYKPLDEVITLAFFSFKLRTTEDNFNKLYQELNIFSSTDLALVASNYIAKLKAKFNNELEKAFGFQHNYADYILRKFTLTTKENIKEIIEDTVDKPNVNLEKFMKLLNQERLRIGSPDVNLLVENINYRIENDLWD